MIRLTGPRQRDYAKSVIDGAPEGYVVIVREPKRNDEQNKRFHAMIDDLVRQNPNGEGYDKDMWKAAVIRSLNKEVQFLRDLDGELFPNPKRSSELTVREMSDAMEIIAEYGARHGVVFSDPNPWEGAA
jgi:hypothetical protein